jgi:hypothetical protein
MEMVWMEGLEMLVPVKSLLEQVMEAPTRS